MKKILSTTFITLAFVTLAIAVCFLFHIGGNAHTSNLMYDQFFALAFAESCIFFLIYLRIERTFNK